MWLEWHGHAQRATSPKAAGGNLPRSCNRRSPTGVANGMAVTRPLHGRDTAVTWPLHGGMRVRGVWCRRHQPPATCLQGGALALLLLLNQWELDVQDPFKRLLGAEFDVERAGAIGFAANRLLHVEFWLLPIRRTKSDWSS